MTAQRCETCKFWVPASDSGLCYRYPPRIIDSVVVELWDRRAEFDWEAIVNASLVPLTDPGQWCGEWQPNMLGVIETPTSPADSHGTSPPASPPSSASRS